MATSPMIGGSDPSILKLIETQTPSIARTAPATVNATTGSATSSGSTVSRGLVPQVSGGTVTYNQATQTTVGNSVAVTSSTNNDPGDVVTIYTSPKAVSVSAINQTINTYKVNNYAGSDYTDSNVANYLPTFSGNVGAGNVNVTGTVYANGLSSTGLASLTILNVSTTANLGAVGNVRITGGTAGQVLSTNGNGVLSWASDATTYGNSNVAAYLPTYTGNIGGNVITANLFSGNGSSLSAIAGANVSGFVPNANVANTAFAVAGANVSGFVPNANVANTAFAVAAANVSGLGNIATINLTGSTSNVLYGNGVFAAVAGGANTGNVTFDDVTVQGVNELNLSAGPDYTANLAYLTVRAGDVASHIHFDTGNSEAYDLIVGNDSKFVQVSSTGNIIMSSYDGNISYEMTLDTTGNLILAGGNSVIQSVANSSLDPLNPNVSTMILTPSTGYTSQALVLDPTAPGHIHLRAPSANIDEPLANIFLGGEESSFEVGYHNGSTPNVYIHSGGNTWTFDTIGSLNLPTIELDVGNTINEQTIIQSQRKIIPPFRYSVDIDGSTPTVVYSATDNSITSMKVAMQIQHTGLGFEFFDVSATSSGSDTYYSVSNRLHPPGITDSTVVVDLDGSNAMEITVTINSGAANCWVTYDATEFGIAVD